MQPLDTLTADACSGLGAVLCDIDDTVTTDGRLAAAAYTALEQLQAAGLLVVPVTGRPAGWCDLIARLWPVDGVVCENGAFAYRYDHAARRMRRSYAQPADVRRINRERLDRLAGDILTAVPGAALSADQPFRIADLAIDFREDVAPLPPAAIDDIVRMFEAAGATAKVSSIHVNGWFGDYDKLNMARRLLADELGIDQAAQDRTVLFVGDSPNDAPMFEAFPLSVGVANVRDHADRIRHQPAFVTTARSGQGFIELVRHIIGARGGNTAIERPR